MIETVEGYVEHIVFRNEDNGYTVLSMSADGEELTVVGNMGTISEGEFLEARGSFVSHAVYGQQFKVEAYETKVPQDENALEHYLGSGAIKGIGAALAARIVRRFKKETLKIIEEQPERLAEIKGISTRKAREIAAQIAEKSEMQNAIYFLSRYHISLSLSVRIYHTYGARLYQVLKENPYKLAEDIAGVGFVTADEIARKMGIRADSAFRIKSALLFCLARASAQGHIYLPKEKLQRQTLSMLSLKDCDPENCLMELAIERKVIIKEIADGKGGTYQAVYAAASYYMELHAAHMLCELNLRCDEDADGIEKKLMDIEKHEDIELDEIQREAVRQAAASGVLILTGGPGTGKTTTINAMIRYFVSAGMDILLGAPTGRAAKRMTEATGYEASTIHRMLELSAPVPDRNAADEARLASEAHMGEKFARNETNPLEADVIIIDEVSMVDIYLLHALLSAIVPGTRLILVGDKDQLPSVGPGSVLKDLIASKAFRVVELKKIFRQAAMSDIVVSAHRINDGQQLNVTNKSRDFFLLKRYDADHILQVMITLISKKLPPYVGVGPEEIQVLSPMRKGALGVENLNRLLQRFLNPPSDAKREKEMPGGIFREGDKVMQIKNNYQIEWQVLDKHGIPLERGLGVFNGDMGRIRQIDPAGDTLTVEFDEHRCITYPLASLDELELAYAVTIHKSQGSEYPAVVIPLLGGPRLLMTRNLLYTAVTRAKNCVVIVGSDITMQAMIDNHQIQSRYTTLALRIREEEQEEEQARS